MARKTIRIDIPAYSPDDLIKLSETIILQHGKPAAASPLDDRMVQALALRTTEAKKKRADADALDAQAKKLRDQAETLLGTAPGQNITTKDTVYYDVTGFRDALEVANRGNEEALSEWGFKVVIGTAAMPKKKPKV